MLSPSTIPFPSKNVVSRAEPEGVILFHINTDEMHFISKDAFSLFSLCDGTRTLAQINDLLAHHNPQFATPTGREAVERFLQSLAERHVLELWR